MCPSHGGVGSRELSGHRFLYKARVMSPTILLLTTPLWVAAFSQCGQQWSQHENGIQHVLTTGRG